MVTKQTTTTQDLKKKKKKWVSIMASPEFNNQEIGETYVEEAEQALGRVVEVNLTMLTKDPKKQNFNAYFLVKEIKNGQAFTVLTAYQLQVAQLKRITRKGKNKLDDSFEYKTKDGKTVTIKPIMITRTLTYKTSLQGLRKACREFLTEYAKNKTGSQVMKDIMDGLLQRDIKNAVKKVTPIINCTIKNALIKD